MHHCFAFCFREEVDPLALRVLLELKEQWVVLELEEQLEREDDLVSMAELASLEKLALLAPLEVLVIWERMELLDLLDTQ